jgi:hypothetical protein
MHRSIAALILTMSVAGGCGHAPPAVQTHPLPTSEELLSAVTARQRAVTTASARARATSWLGGERVRATVNMLIARDGHLRFEAEVSLEGTVATLATDGTHFELWDMRKDELERGPACPANVASLVRIPLAPGDVAAVLLGDARLPPGVPAAGAFVSWDPSRGADTLVLRDRDGGALHLYFQGEAQARRLVGAVRTGPDGSRLWQSAYEDFETVGSVPMPKVIKFAERSGSFDDGVEIHFKDRFFNVPTPAAAFTITPPPTVPVREVGCPPDQP